MRLIAWLLAALETVAMTIGAPCAFAQPLPTPSPTPSLPPPGYPCNYPNCTPGIMPNVVLGADCTNTTYWAFGVTSTGRLVFCGSPRRYAPRWFRSPLMQGVKNENDTCPAMEGNVAQAPDGLFLTCGEKDGRSAWLRGDL